jgi:PDZ domain/Aspartyl protease
MTGTVKTAIDTRVAAFVDEYAIGPTTGGDGFDGTTAWQRDMSGVVVPEAGGDARQIAVNEAYRDANSWWRSDRGGAVIEADGCRSLKGVRYATLTITPRGGKPFQAWFDTASHLLSRTVERQGFQTITTDFGNYGAVAGMQLPRSISTDDGTGPANLQRDTLVAATFEPARALTAFGPPPTHLRDYWIERGASSTSARIEILNDHVVARVWIDGKGPFPFLLDTGGHDIVTPKLVQQLGLRTVGRMESGGAGSATAEGGYVRIKQVRIAGAHLEDQTFFVLRFEPDAVEGFPVAGMLGFETFWRFIARIDYGRRELTLFDAARFHPPVGAAAVPFVFYDTLPEVQGAFAGIPARLNIDTGSRSELDLTKPFVDAHALRQRYHGVLAVTGWGVGGPVQSYVVRASSLELGPVKVSDVVADLTAQSGGSFSDTSYEGNVGSGLLKMFTVTFDYRNRTLYLERRQPPSADAGAYDRSGMWINQAGPDFRVMDITAGSPAAAAGLQPEDLILQVDGTPARFIRLSDLRKRLRDTPPGTRVTLRVLQHRANRRIVLILRDQIPQRQVPTAGLTSPP